MSAEYRQYLSSKPKNFNEAENSDKIKATNGIMNKGSNLFQNRSPSEQFQFQQDSFYAHEPQKTTAFNDFYDTSNLPRNYRVNDSPQRQPQSSSQGLIYNEIVRQTVRFQPKSPLKDSQPQQSIRYKQGNGRNINETFGEFKASSRLLLAPSHPLVQPNITYQHQHSSRIIPHPVKRQNEINKFPLQYFSNQPSQTNIEHIIRSPSKQMNVAHRTIQNAVLQSNDHRSFSPNVIRSQSPSRSNIRFVPHISHSGHQQKSQVQRSEVAEKILLLSNEYQDRNIRPLFNESNSTQYYPTRQFTATQSNNDTNVQQQQSTVVLQPPFVKQPVSLAPAMPIPPHQYFQMQPSILSIASHQSNHDLDRMTEQCKYWEQRCKVLEAGDQRKSDIVFLRQENIKLHQQIIQLQSREREFVRNFEQIVANLVDKYKESTLKEYSLLFERFHLERRRNK